MAGSILTLVNSTLTSLKLKSKRASAREAAIALLTTEKPYNLDRITFITPNPSMHTVELSSRRKVTTSMCSDPLYAVNNGGDVYAHLIELGHSKESIINLDSKGGVERGVESVSWSSSSSSVVGEEDEGSVVWVGEDALFDDSAALGYAVEAVNFDGSASALDNSEARLSALFADFEWDSSRTGSTTSSLFSYEEEEVVETDVFVGAAIEPLRFVRRSGASF